MYKSMSVLLDAYYPERTVTITSADPPYVMPAVKRMMQWRNKLMRLGLFEEAVARAVMIGAAIRGAVIKNFKSAELDRRATQPS